MTNPNLPAGRAPGAGLAPGGLWPAHLPRPQAPGVPAPARPAPPQREQPPVLEEVASARMPWVGVQWTLVYLGFLGYVFAVTTYRLPIGDISMAIALIGLLTQRDRFRFPALIVSFALFLVWAVIGYSLTRDPALVYLRLQVVGKLMVISLVAVNALRTRANIRFFIFFWLACFAFFPVRGALFNYYVYGETVYGRAAWNYIFSNPNDLAAYCILQLGLALGLVSLEKRGPVKWATIAGLAVLPLLILLTRSRGAFLGFAAFLLLVVVGHRKRGKAIVITAILGALVISIAPEDVLDRVRGLEKVQSTEASELAEADAEGSALQRYEIWKVARTIIRDYPVAGVGLGAYPAMHARYARRANFNPTARGRRDTHSTYLNLAAETGFVGLFIYVVGYVGALFRVNTIRRRAKTLLPHTAQTLYVYQAALLGFFTSAVFGSMAHVSFLALSAIVTLALAEVADNEMKVMTAARRTGGPARDGGARPVTV
jgi:probable O-glycosylation ligase (exosortase A-associated)